MKLNAKLFIFMAVLFAVLIALLWFYSNTLLQHINEEWGERFVKKQVIFDKNRTLLPIMREIEKVKKMVYDPAIIAMAEDEGTLRTRQEGIAALEYYRSEFTDHSYFAAFTKSGNYYFNNSNNEFANAQRRYTLSPSRIDDSWFYYSLSNSDEFQINVDKDTELGVTKVWINFILKKGDERLGVLGTGFDFDSFLRESVGVEQDGIRNLFINKRLSIQLARDTKLIDYASMTKGDKKHNSIDKFLHVEDIAQLNRAIEALEEEPESVKTLWVTYEGKKQLLGVAYLPEIGWFSLTLIESKELTLLASIPIFKILSIVFLIAFLIVGWVSHWLFLEPLNHLKKMMHRIEQGDYTLNPSIVGSGEIAELSLQFKHMVEVVQNTNLELETKIQERTRGLLESEQKLTTVLDSVEASIYIKDTQSRYLYANKKMCDLFEKTLEEIIGKDDYAFFDSEAANGIVNNDTKVFKGGEKVVEEEILSQNGNPPLTFLATKIPLLNSKGEIYALCGISSDITERIAVQKRIEELAFYDELTHLPNRRMLEERFTLSLATLKRSQKYGAMVFLDLDNFKPLNDSFGHSAGDALLLEVGKRLLSVVRESDTVSRFGGDEFIILLCELEENEKASYEGALSVARKIQQVLSQPYELELVREDESVENIVHHCTASIGVSLYTKNSVEESIFLRADKAMYKAKEKGRNRIEFCEGDA